MKVYNNAMDTATKQSFVKIVQQHKGIIYKICNSYCRNRDDREDLAQEIVFQLWKSFEGYNPEYKHSTWLYRIALNVAISFYRKQKNARRLVSDEHLFELKEYEDENAEHSENVGRLQQFINELPELDRALMILYLEEKSHREIADILGISESNVGTKVGRIKQKLKQRFSAIGP
ncbi:MAG: sigma-70 family RNA polymerase sigma factor [Cytophagales bacterium]|nr:sigma-70 family RNA polymerase sigma factor [Cytophagales bacterium]